MSWGGGSRYGRNSGGSDMLAAQPEVTMIKLVLAPSLAGGAMHAVESVVAKHGVNTLIPALKGAGARDILEIPISKIVD